MLPLFPWKPYLISDQIGQSVYPFSDQKPGALNENIVQHHLKIVKRIKLVVKR